jgi:hypothetical protein
MVLQQTIAGPRIDIPANDSDDAALGDLRFRSLLSQTDWASLPLPIRRRFSRRLGAGDSVVYVGEVVETSLTWVGRLFGHLARLIGGPLPTSSDCGVPAVVTVTEDAASGGQHWTRLYVRRARFPQVIQSSKQFAGPTGLEEYVGCGVGMALTIHVAADTLLFRSAGYFIRFGGFRVRLPSWITPGRITVGHVERGRGQFLFTLECVHPVFGTIIRQTALFREARA